MYIVVVYQQCRSHQLHPGSSPMTARAMPLVTPIMAEINSAPVAHLTVVSCSSRILTGHRTLQYRTTSIYIYIYNYIYIYIYIYIIIYIHDIYTWYMMWIIMCMGELQYMYFLCMYVSLGWSCTSQWISGMLQVNPCKPWTNHPRKTGKHTTCTYNMQAMYILQLTERLVVGSVNTKWTCSLFFCPH